MSLNSTSVIKIVDLLCEGQIEEIVGGGKGIFLNETAIQNNKGGFNFEKKDVKYILRRGTENQKQFEDHKKANSNVIDISEEIGSNYSEKLNAKNLVRQRDYGKGQFIQQISDEDTDSIQLIFTIPALFCTGMEGIARGQLFNARVKIEILVKARNSNYISVQTLTVKGISTSNYQIKSKIINLNQLKKGGIGGSFKPPFLVKVKKITAKEEDYEVRFNLFETINKKTPLANTRANRVIFTSLIERQEIRTAYPYTACVALSLSTESFSSLPTRAYLIKGIKVKIPSNASVQEDGRLTFPNTFDGKLKKGKFWTTCPVCIFYDLLTNKRYGCGDFIDTANLNWVDLYQLSRYSNELVDTPDGKEARFAINTVIGNQADAYKVLQNLASIFRGMTYWGSNTINLVADHGNLGGQQAPDIDPVHLYTNANVIGGAFSYSGSSLKTRSTSIQVSYNDPDNFYKPNVVVVEDYDLIEKYGYNIKQIVAFGCSSKYQAQRMGQWVLNSEKLDGHVVTFSTGLDGLSVLPSQVFAIADEMRAGIRLSGRILSVDSASQFTPDKNFDTYVGGNENKFEVSVTLSNGTVETQKISDINTSGRITVQNAFSSALDGTLLLVAGAVYTLENKTNNTVLNQKFRCIDIKDNNDSTYTITGLEFNDSIYKVADNTIDTATLEYQDVTAFSNEPTKPTNLEVTSTRLQQQNQSSNRVRFSWSRGLNGPNVTFTVKFQAGKNKGKVKNIEQTIFELDNLKVETEIQFEVRSESIDVNKTKVSNYAKANLFKVPIDLADVPIPLP